MPHVTERTRLDLILAADNLLHLGSLIGEDDTRGRTLRALARHVERDLRRIAGEIDAELDARRPRGARHGRGALRPDRRGRARPARRRGVTPMLLPTHDPEHTDDELAEAVPTLALVGMLALAGAGAPRPRPGRGARGRVLAPEARGPRVRRPDRGGPGPRRGGRRLAALPGAGPAAIRGRLSGTAQLGPSLVGGLLFSCAALPGAGPGASWAGSTNPIARAARPGALLDQPEATLTAAPQVRTTAMRTTPALAGLLAEEADQRLGLLDTCLADDPARPVDHAHAAPFQGDVDPGIVLHGCPSSMPGADPFGPRTHHHSEGQPPRRSPPAQARYRI